MKTFEKKIVGLMSLFLIISLVVPNMGWAKTQTTSSPNQQTTPVKSVKAQVAAPKPVTSSKTPAASNTFAPSPLSPAPKKLSTMPSVKPAAAAAPSATPVSLPAPPLTPPSLPPLNPMYVTIDTIIVTSHPYRMSTVSETLNAVWETLNNGSAYSLRYNGTTITSFAMTSANNTQGGYNVTISAMPGGLYLGTFAVNPIGPSASPIVLPAINAVQLDLVRNSTGVIQKQLRLQGLWQGVNDPDGKFVILPLFDPTVYIKLPWPPTSL